MRGAENIRSGRSRVFFDIEISHQKKGRVVFELVRPETTPYAYDLTRTLLLARVTELLLLSLLMNE